MIYQVETQTRSLGKHTEYVEANNRQEVYQKLTSKGYKRTQIKAISPTGPYSFVPQFGVIR